MKPSHETIRHLYPDLTEKELEEAEINLERYVELVIAIHDRIEAGEKEKQSFIQFPE